MINSQMKKCYLLVREKQTEKQVDALKFLNLSNKTDELKQIEGIFPKKPVE